MTYEPFSVVVIPLPFNDSVQSKKRPALVLSSIEYQQQANHITVMMITSDKNRAWPNDYPIKNLESCGLTAPSIVRPKVFTLDNRLIIKSIGKLQPDEQKLISEALRGFLSLEVNR